LWDRKQKRKNLNASALRDEEDDSGNTLENKRYKLSLDIEEVSRNTVISH
jgi:hypothetical protein